MAERIFIGTSSSLVEPNPSLPPAVGRFRTNTKAKPWIYPKTLCHLWTFRGKFPPKPRKAVKYLLTISQKHWPGSNRQTGLTVG